MKTFLRDVIKSIKLAFKPLPLTLNILFSVTLQTYGSADFQPRIHKQIGDPQQAGPWVPQKTQNDCAMAAISSITRQPLFDVTQTCHNQNWFDFEGGTPPVFIPKILTYFGKKFEEKSFNNPQQAFNHIAEALNTGKQILVGVDNREYHLPRFKFPFIIFPFLDRSYDLFTTAELEKIEPKGHAVTILALLPEGVMTNDPARVAGLNGNKVNGDHLVISYPEFARAWGACQYIVFIID